MGELHKLLLTTSGTGSRLGESTSYTNKCLVRVGEKPAISHILDLYDENLEVVVTLGHFGHLVKDFLLISYPNRKFTFVEIDKYEGEGSSLGYSLLKAKKYLNCSFIFHACDTLPFGRVPLPIFNWLGGTKRSDGSHYRTLNVSGGIVSKINEKGELDYDYDYIGLAGIYDHELFWNALEAEYNLNKNNSQLSDCHAINKMMQIHDNLFELREFPEWQDIGNITSLNRAREKVKNSFTVLDKDDESIYLVDKKIIKFFSNAEVCKNRIARSSVLQPLTPKILKYSDNFYSYDYISGNLFSQSVNTKSFKKFLNWADKELWIKTSESNGKFYDTCREFYFNKTKTRVDSFLSKNNVIDEPNIINGLSVPSVKDMLSDIDEKWFCDVSSYQYHGDFILDNIIETSDAFKLIDWRQDFGGDINNGDIYYDLAKLNHNLVVSHDIIHKDLYDIDIKSNEIKCDILRKNTLVECQKIFDQFCLKNEYDLTKVRVLSAIIWLNMSALHHYPFNVFLFNFGKYNLCKYLSERSLS